ncbi:MAG: FAD-dependent oxidoreductase [Methylococcaceae bacterium]|nr:FAD-dependent oxidoreductase [Methylococcaceae bacterium]
MTTTSDITIIGGGIIGLLTAREFIKTGATVTVIEKNLLGQESSWAGGGILLPLYPWRQADAITRLVLQSLQLYPHLAVDLLNDTGIDPEWNPCGLLITKNPDITAAVNWCESNHIAFQDADSEFFNELNTVPVNPLWMPSIAQARNPRLVKSLKQYLINHGCDLREHCTLTAVSHDNKRINSITTSNGAVAVNELIISAGAWTGQLFQQFIGTNAPNIIGTNAPNIAPVKGQMVLFDAKPDTLRHIVLDNDQYLIPRLDGKILAGSTVEHDDFNKIPSKAAHDQLTDFARTLFPVLNDYPIIKHWAGLRPGTEHGVPYIGRHPNIANLSINAGHFRNGLVMGPASAQLLVDLLLNRPTAIAPEPYRLDRP